MLVPTSLNQIESYQSMRTFHLNKMKVLLVGYIRPLNSGHWFIKLYQQMWYPIYVCMIFSLEFFLEVGKVFLEYQIFFLSFREKSHNFSVLHKLKIITYYNLNNLNKVGNFNLESLTYIGGLLCGFWNNYCKEFFP